jgi:hypothetical protein
MPMAAEALNPEPSKPNLFRKGQRDRGTRLQPSLQIVRGIGANVLPVTLGALLRQPLVLCRPFPGCYGNKRRLLSSCMVGFSCALLVVSVCLGGFIAINADLPGRRTRGNPGIAVFAQDLTVPPRSTHGLACWKGNLGNGTRLHGQSPNQPRQLALGVAGLCPTLNVPGGDLQR